MGLKLGLLVNEATTALEMDRMRIILIGHADNRWVSFDRVRISDAEGNLLRQRAFAIWGEVTDDEGLVSVDCIETDETDRLQWVVSELDGSNWHLLCSPLGGSILAREMQSVSCGEGK